MFYGGELPVRQYQWLCAKLAPHTYGDRARSQSEPLIRSSGSSIQLQQELGLIEPSPHT
jgi:hypothetical protein